MNDGYDRFSQLTLRYLAVVVAAIVLQSIPIVGLIAALALAFLWIGIGLHVYALKIAYDCVTGRLPHAYLVVPACLYGAGIATGLYSDIRASRWAAAQQWMEVDQAVPAEVTRLKFEPWNEIEHLHDSSGVFRPEQLGFDIVSYHPIGGNRIYVYDSKARPYCYHVKGGSQVGDRCYRREGTKFVGEYVEIRNASKLVEPRKLNWATLYEGEKDIVLHGDGKERVVGHLRSAIVRKLPYVLLPTIGCGQLFSSSGKFACDYSFTFLSRDTYVGFFNSGLGSSEQSAPLLMGALERLRALPAKTAEAPRS
jgi:hypothetical protein